MSNVLIVFGSTYGQTEKIANVIGSELKKLGHSADYYNSINIPAEVDLKSYDAIIVGASVQAGRFQGSLKKWVKKNARYLRDKPSAFYSVCLGILQKEEAIKQKEIKTVKDFFFRNNWQPKYWTIFAGALTYSRYNWFIKRIMHSLVKKAGSETDISRDYDFTDWDDVRRFSREFSTHIPRRRKKNTERKLV